MLRRNHPFSVLSGNIHQSGRAIQQLCATMLVRGQDKSLRIVIT